MKAREIKMNRNEKKAFIEAAVAFQDPELWDMVENKKEYIQTMTAICCTTTDMIKKVNRGEVDRKTGRMYLYHAFSAILRLLIFTQKNNDLVEDTESFQDKEIARYNRETEDAYEEA